MNEKDLTFIMGSSRSGSTWLLEMLGELPTVGTVDDPHLGHHLGTWRPISLAAVASKTGLGDLTTLYDLKRDDPNYIFADGTRRTWQPLLRELLLQTFALSQVHRGPVVVKEPACQTADLLMKTLPEARLLWLLRDGRDVVDSWLDAYQSGSWGPPNGQFPLRADGRIALIRWLSAVWCFRTLHVRAVWQSLLPPRRWIVRYEAMLNNPDLIVEEVRGWLGVDCQYGDVVSAVEKHAFETKSNGTTKRVRRAKPGGWRRSMSEDEIAVMQGIMQPVLAQHGYHT